MRKTLSIILFLFAASAFAADGPVDRWARAVGGKEKIAAIKAIYREGTLQFGGMEGSIKVWHTADGRYRKEEQVGIFSSIETFDGTSGVVQKGGAGPQRVTGADLPIAKSKAYANSNAMFFVFSSRRAGTLTTEDDTIVFKPEGGIEWRVTLDPQTSLPKTMLHNEGDKTITVTFASWETVDGITLEKEIHRSNGMPGMGAVIRFNKTVINPPVDASLFTIETH
jgi:hypothetical protein